MLLFPGLCGSFFVLAALPATIAFYVENYDTYQLLQNEDSMLDDLDDALTSGEIIDRFFDNNSRRPRSSELDGDYESKGGSGEEALDAKSLYTYPGFWKAKRSLASKDDYEDDEHPDSGDSVEEEETYEDDPEEYEAVLPKLSTRSRPDGQSNSFDDLKEQRKANFLRRRIVNILFPLVSRNNKRAVTYGLTSDLRDEFDSLQMKKRRRWQGARASFRRSRRTYSAEGKKSLKYSGGKIRMPRLPEYVRCLLSPFQCGDY